MSEVITLNTVQHARDWEELQRKGVLRRTSVDFFQRYTGPHVLRELRMGQWQAAYAFMAQQMRKRIPECSVVYPIWAWHKPAIPPSSSPLHKWLREDGSGVSIEFKVLRKHVLISDLDPWRFVLNNEYVALSAEEYEGFKEKERRYKNDGDMRDAISCEIVKSWERVFDLDSIESSEYWRHSGVYLQACVEEIRLEQVVSVTKFPNKEL